MSSSTSIYTAPKSYHCTYWITNTKLQKHYIGVHTSKIPPIHDLGIKYFSSSSDKEFKKDQKSNPQDYEYKIIGLFPSRKEASLNEIELHEVYNVGANPRFYNRAKSTTTGFNTHDMKHTEKTKDKMSDSAKKRPPMTEEHKKNISDAKKNPSEETIKRLSESHKGKKASDESKLKRKLNTPSKVGENNPMYGIKGVDNPNYGSKRTDEFKEKASKRQAGSGKVIAQIDKITEELIREATINVYKDDGFSSGSIWKCCENKLCKYSHKNYYWQYV